MKAVYEPGPLRRSPYSSFILAISVVLLAACGHHKTAKVNVPEAPPIAPGSQHPPQPPATARQESEEDEKIDVPADATVIFEETGLASWYGAPYHNRRGSNGEIYNMHAMTAAHRTLPLGSIVRVTNLKTGSSAVVRITDRGPFVDGRIVDLSLAAAKAVDVYVPGVAKVRVQVLKTPAPLDSGGRWAVQIGSFPDEKDAEALVDRLQRRYHTAKVSSFSSPVGDWWVRVRVAQDDRARAESLARETVPAKGSVFLVRLD
jgi:rare lipoprotein A